MKTRIVGLDISLNSSGISILESNSLKTFRIEPTGITRREKLASIYEQFSNIWNELGYIDLVVIEESISTKYINIVQKIMGVHGVVLATMAAAGVNCNILYVHPISLKKYVTGSGRASKEEIQKVIEAKTGITLQYDESDATALVYIGMAVTPSTVLWDETKLSKIKNDNIEQDIYREFGLSIDKVKEMRKERAKASRKKYKENR